MQKKLVSSFLVFAIALVTVAPPRTSGQTTTQTLAPPATSANSNLSALPEKAKFDLKTSLAAEMAKIKAGTLTEADAKRLEQDQQDQQAGDSHKPSFTRKQKMFLALWIVVMTGLVVVLIKHGCKAPKPCPEPDPTQDYSY